MKHLSASAIPLVLCALLVTGCGSSKKSASSTTTAAATNRGESYSSLIAKADAICSQVNTEVAAAQKTTDYDALITSTTAGVAKLKRLKPPAQLTSAYASFLSDVDANEAVAVKLVAAIKAKDAAGVKALNSQSEATDQTVNTAAAHVGLQVCSKDS